MDIDRINDLIDRLRALRRELDELLAEAKALDVELDEGSIMERLGYYEGLAAVCRKADREALSRAYERMALR